MRKIYCVWILALLISACGSGQSNKKRNLDATLYKYASMIRWSDYEAAKQFLKPGESDIQPSSFELERLKQYKVSQYLESPIAPGTQENIIIQQVRIELYNIHNNRTKTINDTQSWEYNEELKQWFLTSGIPKLQ